VVTSIETAPLDPGFVVLYIAGKPDKEKIAIREFEKQVEKLHREPPTQEELERARNYLLGVRDIAREKFATVRRSLSAGELFHHDPLFSYRYDRMLSEVTPETIRELARQLL